MTIEQIELRKILTQMLADNGINRETLKDMIKEILEEKVEKAVQKVVSQTNMESLTYSEMRKTIENSATDIVRRAFRSTHLSIEIRSGG